MILRKIKHLQPTIKTLKPITFVHFIGFFGSPGSASQGRVLFVQPWTDAFFVHNQILYLKHFKIHMHLSFVNEMLTSIHILFTICLQVAYSSQTYEGKHSWHAHPINSLLSLSAQPMLSPCLWDAITNPLANQETWHHSPLKFHQTDHTPPKKWRMWTFCSFTFFFSRKTSTKIF